LTGLKLSGVSVTYGTVDAVIDAAFDVAQGETVAIVGPSGSGKSSVLAAIAGLVPYSGVIRWGDIPLDDMPTHKRGVGMVFQDGQLFPNRDVRGNIAFGLEMAKVDRAEIKTRVEGLLALVGLEGMGSRRIDELSGGERQRVALARSLAPQPRVLLLDEPLSSLDSALRKRLAVDVRDILLASRTAAIVVTHDVDEAQVMGSRVLAMDSGRLTEPSAA